MFTQNVPLSNKVFADIHTSFYLDWPYLHNTSMAGGSKALKFDHVGAFGVGLNPAMDSLL